MNKVITTGLIAGLLLGVVGPTLSDSVVVEANTSPVAKYKDFDASASWAKPMEWAINKGLLSGYIEKNKSGNSEYLLKPNQFLTESQLLTILYRFTEPASLKDYSIYELSLVDNLPTVVKGANKPITRGKMAQILATKYYHKVVTEKVAVNFMYKAGLSSGYAVNGKYPQTYESFGANNQLKRAHITQFFQAYDAFLASTKSLPIPITSDIYGITVQYGQHNYGSRNQNEYDTVMAIAKKAIADFKWDARHKEYLDAYLNGERFNGDRNDRSAKNMDLFTHESSYGDLLKAGATNKQVIDMVKAETIAASLMRGIHDPLDGSPRSAYDALVLGVADCDPQAHIRSMVFDIMGFNSMMYGGDAHTDMFLNVGSSWFRVVGGSFSIGSKSEITSSDGWLWANPTYGEF